MFFPTFAEFKKRCQHGNLIPVYAELPADVETPVSAFLKIAEKSSRAFLLESVEGGERLARYSFLGADPSEVVAVRGGVVEHTQDGQTRIVSHGGDPFAVLRELMKRYKTVDSPDLPPFHGGAVGYLSYDLVRHFERLPSRNPDELGLPEALLVFTENLLVFDHVKHVIKVVSNAHVTGSPERAYKRATASIRQLMNRLAGPLPKQRVRPGNGRVTLKSNTTREKFLANVARCKDYIKAGDIFQIQISQRLSGAVPVEPFEVYRALRTINPSPYMYYLRFPECEVIGSSPEMLVRKQGQTVSTRPIAGTYRRGETPEEDARQAEILLADPKERAEHIMLVDLGRNDLGRVCRYGSVHVPELMVVERYSHVMHIVSHVQGKLLPGKDQFDVLRAAYPAGTVTGAPKIRAMQIIEELEACRRGPYAGAVGYLDYSGNLDSAITIRTLVYAQGQYHVQAAAGIVADSKPEKEYQETLNKMQASIKALELASRRQNARAAKRSKS
jgi:anthranilate synthase component 1